MDAGGSTPITTAGSVDGITTPGQSFGMEQPTQSTQQPANDANGISNTVLEIQKPKPMEIKIVLPTNAYFMSGIRDFTLSMIRNMTDFSEQWAFRFQSVVDELCNNAIEHGSSKEDTIEITFVNYPGEAIELFVADHGTGPNQYMAEQISLIAEKNKLVDPTKLGIRGRGLAKIVSEWTDELEFKDNAWGGITVRVKKYLNDARFQQILPDTTDPTHIVIDA